MESLLQKIQKNCETYQLAVSEKKLESRNYSKSPLEVVACVSGGSDSVALFHILQRLSTLLRLKLHILHFNHQLRPEAQQEQDFVESLAKQYKIPFHYISWGINHDPPRMYYGITRLVFPRPLGINGCFTRPPNPHLSLSYLIKSSSP